MRPLLLPLVLSAALAATACATPADTPVASEKPPAASPAPDATPMPKPKPPRDAEPAPGEPIMECDAGGTEWAIGKVADETLVERIKAQTNSERVRVIKPGMMVTMDFRGDRVNLDVDAENRVTSVRCG